MTDLSKRVADALALREKATPEPWVTSGKDGPDTMIAAIDRKNKVPTIIAFANGYFSKDFADPDANAAFIANAHAMADLISDLHSALVAAEADAARLQAMISGEWYVCFDQDGEQCRVWAVDPRSDDGSRQMTDWHDDPREAIDAAMEANKP